MIKVLIIDTSILCVWLKIPGMETCGPSEDLWDIKRVDSKIQEEIQNKTTLVLPLATIIETGNHISQSNRRLECATALADLMRKTADNQTPWAAFTDQSILWSKERITILATDWPNLALQKLSLGDATIKDVAEYYAQVYKVEILTGDRGLKAYQPIEKQEKPRRRQRG